MNLVIETLVKALRGKRLLVCDLLHLFHGVLCATERQARRGKLSCCETVRPLSDHDLVSFHQQSLIVSG
jgi:hypothetical protein